MVSNILFRFIFAYYIIPDRLDDIIYRYHLVNINHSIEMFKCIDFYLLIDNVDDNETIEYVKKYIMDHLYRKDLDTVITFTVIKNDPYWREGHVYLNAFLMRLKEYAENNELVMFGHTKGLTNKYVQNSINWINLIYWSHCQNVYYSRIMLLRDEYKNIISFGAIYNYSEKNLSKYNWLYTGGFSTVNAKRLYDYILEHEPDYLEQVTASHIYIRVCAENWLNDVLDVDRVSFIDHHLYNLRHDYFLNDAGHNEYENIEYTASARMTWQRWNEYLEYKKTITDLVENETADNI